MTAQELLEWVSKIKSKPTAPTSSDPSKKTWYVDFENFKVGGDFKTFVATGSTPMSHTLATLSFNVMEEEARTSMKGDVYLNSVADILILFRFNHKTSFHLLPTPRNGSPMGSENLTKHFFNDVESTKNYINDHMLSDVERVTGHRAEVAPSSKVDIWTRLDKLMTFLDDNATLLFPKY